MTILDLDALALVTGGNDQLAAAQAMTARSQECGKLVSSLNQGQQNAPSGFAAACGDLHPEIQEGRRVSRGIDGRLTTR